MNDAFFSRVLTNKSVQMEQNNKHTYETATSVHVFLNHIHNAAKGDGGRAHWPSGKSVGLRIGRPGFDPRPGRCVVSLSKRHLLPKSTGNIQKKMAPSQHD